MMRIRDDRGRVIALAKPPVRVVSLVPSDTLNVCAVGGASALVGRTDYCELPAEVVASVPSVGGTKNPRVDDVCDLAPDLVIANQEENTRGDLEKLAQRGVVVLVAFPKRVADGLAHLARLARIFGTERDAAVKDLVRRGYDAHRHAEEARKRVAPIRVFCPIWMSPLMTIHGATFISDMLDLCGAQNVFADRERRYPLAADIAGAKPLSPEKLEGRDVRYPRVTFDEVVARSPEIVLLPDEPHPFSEEDARVFAAQGIPAAKREGAIIRMSGKDLCWYGARSVEGINRVRALVDQLRVSVASAPKTA
jgi:ABC-type Fe3+-hydroxamate transport system substrate-binding protein